jgi:hypothetical protein
MSLNLSARARRNLSQNKQLWHTLDIGNVGANEVIGANYTVTTPFFKAIIGFLAQISIDFY